MILSRPWSQNGSLHNLLADMQVSYPSSRSLRTLFLPGRVSQGTQNIVNRYFKPLLRRTGLPDIRWHDLRHTCTTLLLGRGVHPKMVQHLMGHASIQLTLDRYSHWIPSMRRATAEGMDEALG
jgi:integrase